MKDKNLPDDNNSQSLEELTNDVNNIIELLEKEKDTPEYKYQFLCDEQEKLIYRCNKVTGEIECYSNRNDKLKILSSIK